LISSAGLSVLVEDDNRVFEEEEEDESLSPDNLLDRDRLF
jgi:hypothetical protein